MSRVLGASVFLNGFRRRHALRATLTQLAAGNTVPLSTVLDAWSVDETEFTSDLAKLQALGFEVVVRPAAVNPASSPPAEDSGSLKTSAI